MIFVTIKIELRTTKQKELAQTLCALVRRVRKEVGCLSSQIYRDLENKNTLCVFEQWASQADFDTHRRSHNFRVLCGAVKLLNESVAELRFHSVSRTLGEEAIEAACKHRESGQ